MGVEVTVFGPVAADLARVEELLFSTVEAEGEPMAGPMLDLLRAGGKRIRPALVLLCGRLGAYDFEPLAAAAAAVEVVHAATLVHDDVIDRSSLRRGQPTVAAELGDPSAIVIGDNYFAKAYQLAARSGELEVVDRLAAAVMTICRGELLQQRSRFHYRPSLEEYMGRIEAKTAALLATSCWAGGRLAGLDGRAASSLTEYGRCLGRAFQIADDVLDYTAGEAELGKPVGHDLVEGHSTYPLMLALEDPAAAARLSGLLIEGRPIERQTAAEVVTVVRACGATGRALAAADGHAADARSWLAGFPAGPARDTLEELTRYVVSRRL
ncbi:MAG: polyprenyl synthetase family protein [Candidatus Dormibacteraceae bacterium]